MSVLEEETASACHEQEVSTSEAIIRSRSFLETKLIPDLEQAIAFVSHLEENKEGYLRLQQELKTTLQQQQQEQQQEKVETVSVLAHLGQGVHLPVDIAFDALIIVSSGLKEFVQDNQSDSGLFLHLDRQEAISFAASKIDSLNRRITMAKERVALIQSHAELTTKSINQLEQLQADPSSTLIDYLQA